MAHGGFKDILKNGGFHAFLWTQFLGAFNEDFDTMACPVDPSLCYGTTDAWMNRG
jgi:hypothetical protein